MSSNQQTVDVGAILSGVFSALVNAFNALINFFANNVGTIVTIVLIAGIVGLSFYMVRRFGRNIVGWFRRLIPF